MNTRDPTDGVLTVLRRRLAAGPPLQGEPLSINAIAAELGLSHTPVREALARLAGEGLIARTSVGYRGVMHDAASLSGLYGLAGLLAVTLVRVSGAVEPSAHLSPKAFVAALAAQATNRVLAGEYVRAVRQLAPFADAEAEVLSPDPWSPSQNPGRATEAVRRYYARRVRRCGAILAAAIAAQISSKL